jgi:hypothetical protein
MTSGLVDDLKTTKREDINNIDSKLYKLNALKTIILRIFSDKEAHKDILPNYIMELQITKSNSMESYQRDILRHLKQYENIKGTERKKITNTIIKQYRKINEPAFQTGLNTKIFMGPTEHKYHQWIVNKIKWMITTGQDLISRNLCCRH